MKFCTCGSTASRAGPAAGLDASAALPALRGSNVPVLAAEALMMSLSLQKSAAGSPPCNYWPLRWVLIDVSWWSSSVIEELWCSWKIHKRHLTTERSVATGHPPFWWLIRRQLGPRNGHLGSSIRRINHLWGSNMLDGTSSPAGIHSSFPQPWWPDLLLFLGMFLTLGAGFRRQTTWIIIQLFFIFNQIWRTFLWEEVLSVMLVYLRSSALFWRQLSFPNNLSLTCKSTAVQKLREECSFPALKIKLKSWSHGELYRTTCGAPADTRLSAPRCAVIWYSGVT